MQLTVNGEVCDLADGSTVGDLVVARAAPAQGLAVARNAEVVPRSAWATTTLVPGDRVELLIAAQGG